MTSPLDDTGNGRVSYTVKELLAKLDEKIDKFVAALEHKADLAQLTQARKDINALELRVNALEDQATNAASLDAYRRDAERQRKSDRKWLIGLAVTTCVAVLAIAANAAFNLFT